MSEFPAIERALALMRERLRPSADEQDPQPPPLSRLARLAELARSHPRPGFGVPRSARRSWPAAVPEADQDLLRRCFRALERHAERRAALLVGLAAAGSRLGRLLDRRFSPALCQRLIRRRGAGRLADLFRALRLKRAAMQALLAASVGARLRAKTARE